MSFIVLDNALKLARQKVRCFPVRANSKLPAVANFSQKASCDPGQLTEFFGATDYNSGIACGKVAEGLYLVGFDIDTKPGKNGYETLELLEELDCKFPATWSQKTPSGGEHRLFWSPIPIRQGTNVLGAGIDLRGEGGYLVGPGSNIGGIFYSPLLDLPIAVFPDWAIEKYQKLATVHTLATFKNKGVPVENQIYALKQAVEFLATLDPVHEGGRSDACFRVVARLKDFGLAQEQVRDVLVTHWACDPMLTDEELGFTIANAYRYSKNSIGVAAPENLFPPAPEEVTPHPAEKTPIQVMNDRFFYYAADGVSRVCEEVMRDGRVYLERYPVANFHEKFGSFKMSHEGKTIKTTKVWMDHADRRTYSHLKFHPGAGRTVDDTSYNTWRGFAVKAAPAADVEGVRSVELFLEHVEQNICRGNKDHSKWLLGYMAHIFQCPEEKPEVSLVFQGRKGTGKTIVSTILGDMIGNHAVILANRQHVLGHFNSIMEDKLLVTLDEAFWSGDKSVEGTLKDIITGRERVITHKGAEPYPAKVFDRIVIIGNEARLVPATADERRFAVFTVGEGRQQDRAFFGEMKRGLMKHGGLELLMYYLMNLDITGVDINCAPATEGLNRQKEESFDPFEQWWHNCLREGTILGSGLPDWPEEISCQDLFTSFNNHLDADRYRGYRPSRISLGMRMLHVAKSCNTGKKKKVRTHFLAPLDSVRMDWDKYMRFETNWE
jgi:hypothetical protein